MRVETVHADHAIDWSPHHHAFVNPYNGCPTGCPYCFWLSQPGWEGRIQVRENIPELLEQQLKSWPKDEYIYLGSICDPFMELDREYGLTRRCLELIRQCESPLLITTSAVNDVIFRDVDILTSMRQRVVIVVELSRIELMEDWNRGGRHIGIENANRLAEMGLEVWTTLAPILPQITELEAVLTALKPQIPVYIDSLQCKPDSIQARKTMDWICRDYPQNEEQYAKIVHQQDLSYFDEIRTKYKDNPRVMTFPYKL